MNKENFEQGENETDLQNNKAVNIQGSETTNFKDIKKNWKKVSKTSYIIPVLLR